MDVFPLSVPSRCSCGFLEQSISLFPFGVDSPGKIVSWIPTELQMIHFLSTALCGRDLLYTRISTFFSPRISYQPIVYQELETATSLLSDADIGTSKLLICAPCHSHKRSVGEAWHCHGNSQQTILEGGLTTATLLKPLLSQSALDVTFDLPGLWENTGSVPQNVRILLSFPLYGVHMSYGSHGWASFSFLFLNIEWKCG